MKQMERTFQKYLNFRKSDEDVLASLLLALTRDAQRYNAVLRRQGTAEEDLQSIEVRLNRNDGTRAESLISLPAD